MTMPSHAQQANGKLWIFSHEATTPAPLAAAAEAEARDVSSGGAKPQSTDGPPSNAIGLKRKGTRTDAERGAFASGNFLSRLASSGKRRASIKSASCRSGWWLNTGATLLAA